MSGVWRTDGTDVWKGRILSFINFPQFQPSPKEPLGNTLNALSDTVSTASVSLANFIKPFHWVSFSLHCQIQAVARRGIAVPEVRTRAKQHTITLCESITYAVAAFAVANIPALGSFLNAELEFSGSADSINVRKNSVHLLSGA